MPNARFGDLGSANVAVGRFVVGELEAAVLRVDCPASINIDVAFARFLQAHGVSGLTAEEVAADQRDLVRRRLTAQIDRWTGQGVPTPVNFIVESEEIVISWRHERFAELTGGEPPEPNFVLVYDWIGAQTNRAFLLPCICFLKLLRCDPIFVTDGARDEGVDCIGLIASGGLRSTAIFVQAKSQSDWFARDPLLQEYAKYAALPRTHRYMSYLDALGVSQRHDGSGFLYAVMTSSDFQFAARQSASKLGVLLRSRRQLAQFLATRYSAADLERIRTEVAIPATGDLTVNLALRLSP
jgi:hypothetical protein